MNVAVVVPVALLLADGGGGHGASTIAAVETGCAGSEVVTDPGAAPKAGLSERTLASAETMARAASDPAKVLAVYRGGVPIVGDAAAVGRPPTPGVGCRAAHPVAVPQGQPLN